jgi:tetratricopeptide (TPR) repeat protein
LCYYGLGRSLLDKTRLDEAIHNFRIAGETQERLLGRVNQTTANSFNDIGIAYHESGNIDEAEKWYRYR